MPVNEMLEMCVKCGTKTSSKWWKCCPRHTSEQGPDVICEVCAVKLHPDDDSINKREVTVDLNDPSTLQEWLRDQSLEERCPHEHFYAITVEVDFEFRKAYCCRVCVESYLYRLSARGPLHIERK